MSTRRVEFGVRSAVVKLAKKPEEPASDLVGYGMVSQPKTSSRHRAGRQKAPRSVCTRRVVLREKSEITSVEEGGTRSVFFFSCICVNSLCMTDRLGCAPNDLTTTTPRGPREGATRTQNHLSNMCDAHTHLFHWDADLTRAAVQHRLRIPFRDQDTRCPLCGSVLDRFCDLAAVRPCAGDRECRHKAIAHVFYEAAHEARHRPLNTKIPNERSTTQPTNASEIASASLQWLSMGMQEVVETQHATWSLGSPTLSSISNWLSASLRHSTTIPRVPFCDVSVWLPQEQPDEWWPAWDVPDPDGQPTSTPESVTTTTTMT